MKSLSCTASGPTKSTKYRKNSSWELSEPLEPSGELVSRYLMSAETVSAVATVSSTMRQQELTAGQFLSLKIGQLSCAKSTKRVAGSDARTDGTVRLFARSWRQSKTRASSSTRL